MKRLVATMLSIALTTSAQATGPNDPDQRAAETEARMTVAERIGLLHGIVALPFPGLAPLPEGIPASSGRVFGVPRLGVPDLAETDASLGVTNPFGARKGDFATALPSALSLAASFDPELAEASGALIGAESRAKGFNVLLAGGVNLTRDWFGGRNFEYLGEDPLLAGTLAGASVRGIQRQGVIATVKHLSLNSQETLRDTLDARIDEAAHRESDLLAFQLAIEQGRPGSVMCSYNKINGEYGCGNAHLLNDVLKRDWGFKGWVMSDWGAVHDVSYFANGLDQQSGAQLDKKVWFNEPLKAELAAGRVSRERLSDAVQRILRSIYAVGADWQPSPQKIDTVSHAALARKAAGEGMVLLKNDGVLPLANSARSILVIGQQADTGVMSGWGSSQVLPEGGFSAVIPVGGTGAFTSQSRQNLVGRSPVKALQAALPAANVQFESGYYPEAAVERAKRADLVIVMAGKWQGESLDATSLTLPQGQDALIEAVAQANSNVVVVLQTGNPVAMPWLDRVKAVVQAWYPGQEGAEAIADVLIGKVNPSARLPMTFPRSESDAPRSAVPGLGEPVGTNLAVEYSEGSEVGYRWYSARGRKPLFPFGHGLSYTSFSHNSLKLARRGNLVTASFSVTNTGAREGADVPQLYLVDRLGKPVRRLVAFSKVWLAPGETRTVSVSIDRRLLAHWDGTGWLVLAGRYRLAIGKSAEELEHPAEITMPEQRFTK